ncbi:MAG: DOMON-like domain-containing protein [Cyanobacteria bacterium P01_D01_bin.14]
MAIYENALRPFKPDVGALELEVNNRVSRRRERLTLTYEVLGDLDALVVPNRLEHPERRDNLWESTCFELFLAPLHFTHYWEFNLSPSRSWNLYRFDDYRQGRRPEGAVETLEYSVLITPAVLQIALVFDLGLLGVAEQPLNGAISAVTQAQSGQLTYWALTHPAAEPDFHHRGSFVLTF